MKGVVKKQIFCVKMQNFPTKKHLFAISSYHFLLFSSFFAFFLTFICTYRKKVVLLHRVFHGIRFKVKRKGWVVGRQPLFFLLSTHPKECKIFIQEKRLISQTFLGYLISIGYRYLFKNSFHSSAEHIILHSIADNYHLSITHHFLRCLFRRAYLGCSCGRRLFTLA